MGSVLLLPRSLAAALVACAIAAAPARAADAGPEAEAMALYAQGEEHYNAGRVDEALVAFRQAYKRLPAPGLLVNIGQCLRQLGDHENAIRAFERYLKEDPEAENRAEVEELIAGERALLAGPTASAPAATEPAATAPAATAPAASAPAATAPAATAPTSAADGDGSMLWLSVGGAAVVLAVGGAVVVGVMAAQPQPLPVSGSLGTFDLR
ncbi:MAG: hypothetical protein A2138_15385 [Deltaproteobacteria bacterium RBG_16_71_12]|nr:MAG: hypothetical protein A2138_15385 [Deltaproteobacteria bacterium RBG_16_71_12]